MDKIEKLLQDEITYLMRNFNKMARTVDECDTLAATIERLLASLDKVQEMKIFQEKR